MPQTIHSALENLKEIYMSDSSLATMLDFERVVDELDVYAFKNWKLGELVEGPIYEKYFVTATFMWPYSKMPDPRGGEQLLNYNCEVLYKKDELEYPVKPKSPKDFNPGTKIARTKTSPVWLVTITMPKNLMTDIQRGSLELENETIDMEDVERAYEEGEDEDIFKPEEGQANGNGAPGQQAPAAAPMAPQPAAPGGQPNAQQF